MYRIVNKIFCTGSLARSLTSKKEKEQSAQRIS